MVVQTRNFRSRGETGQGSMEQHVIEYGCKVEQREDWKGLADEIMSPITSAFISSVKSAFYTFSS